MPAKPLTPSQQDDARRLKAIFEFEKTVRPGLSQAVIADECGWKTQAAVSQYMNGKIPLTIEAHKIKTRDDVRLCRYLPQ